MNSPDDTSALPRRPRNVSASSSPSPQTPPFRCLLLYSLMTDFFNHTFRVIFIASFLFQTCLRIVSIFHISGTCQSNSVQEKTWEKLGQFIYIRFTQARIHVNTFVTSVSFKSITWITSLSSPKLPFYFAPKMVANVVPSYLIEVSNVGQPWPSRERSVPHVFSTRINKRDISTSCWHMQFLLEEIEERFAIFFVRLLINVVETILYIIIDIWVVTSVTFGV